MTAIKARLTKLNSFYGIKKSRMFQYKYFCKSRSFKSTFSESLFNHVNFKGSIMTSCCFKKCTFNGVEFLGTNLKKCNFESAYFKDVIFVGALIDGCKFKNVTFENVMFVNTNLENAKMLDQLSPQITILNEYPKIDISPTLKAALEELRENNHILKFKILHLTTKKYNHLNLMILLDSFTEEDLIAGLRLAKLKVNKDMCTISCLKNYLKKVI